MVQNLKETIAKLEGKDYLREIKNFYSEDFIKGASFLENSHTIKTMSFIIKVNNKSSQIIYKDGEEMKLIFHINYNNNCMLIEKVDNKVYEKLLSEISTDRLEENLNKVLLDQITLKELNGYNDDQFIDDLNTFLESLSKEELVYEFNVLINEKDLEYVEDAYIDDIDDDETISNIVENHIEEYDYFMLYDVGNDLLERFIEKNDKACKFFELKYEDSIDECVNICDYITDTNYPIVKVNLETPQ